MREERATSLMKITGGAFLLLFCLLPVVWMLIVSFCRNPDFLAAHVPYVFTTRNYADILMTPSVHMLAFLRNSLIVSAVSAFLATFIASLSAYAVTRIRFPGRVLIPVLLLAFSMFPQISLVGYLFKLMTDLGWINTYPALIFPYATLGLPLALWIMVSYFSQIPVELDRAALVDGASRLQIVRRIIFPLAVPGALSTALLVFVLSFNEFLFALIFTVDDRARTIPVGIALFEGLHGQVPWGYIMASAAVALVPLILLAAAFQKHIVQGLTRGALKG